MLIAAKWQLVTIHMASGDSFLAGNEGVWQAFKIMTCKHRMLLLTHDIIASTKYEDIWRAEESCEVGKRLKTSPGNEYTTGMKMGLFSFTTVGQQLFINVTPWKGYWIGWLPKLTATDSLKNRLINLIKINLRLEMINARCTFTAEVNKFIAFVSTTPCKHFGNCHVTVLHSLLFVQDNYQPIDRVLKCSLYVPSWGSVGCATIMARVIGAVNAPGWAQQHLKGHMPHYRAHITMTTVMSPCTRLFPNLNWYHKGCVAKQLPGLTKP